MSTEQQPLGYYDGDVTLDGKFEPPPGAALPVVEFTYVPMAQDEMAAFQSQLNRCGNNVVKMQMALMKMLAERLRAWSMMKPAPTPDAEPVPVEITVAELGRVDHNIIDGIATEILNTGGAVETATGN